MSLAGKQITVVIPTHNRHSLLENTLEYYDNFDVSILVIDSTEEPFVGAGRYKNAEYVHCPLEGLPHKLRRPIVEKVNTKYMVMSADDMVIASESVSQCMDFLESHPDYVTVQGVTLGVGVFPGSDSYETLALYADNGNFDSDICSDEPQWRMLQMFGSYVPTFYAVSRTDLWKWQLSLYPDVVVNYHLAECFLSIASTFAGKQRILPCTYSVTSLVTPVAANDLKYRNDLIALITLPRYAEEYDAFCSILSTVLMQKGGMSKKRALSFIQKAVVMQAWSPKPSLTVGQKMRRELSACITRIFDRKGRAERRIRRRKAEEDAYRENTAHFFAIVGAEGKRIAQRLGEKLRGG